MKKTAISDVIGRREYKVKSGGVVKVLVGRPNLCAHGEAIDGFYCCHFQIDGIGDDQIMTSCGIDELAAIASAFRMIGARLHTSVPGQNGELIWAGKVDNDELGFPEP